MFGAVIVVLAALGATVEINRVLRRDKTIIGERLAQTSFVVGIVCGAASLYISYISTARSTTVHIGDCTAFKPIDINCGVCTDMLSPNSRNGYLEAWWGKRGNNWLDIVALS